MKSNIVENIGHDALSSYLTEHYFQNAVLERDRINFTRGWCYAYENKTKEKFFFLIKKSLNPLDHEVIDILSEGEYAFYQVYYDNDELIFKNIITKKVFCKHLFIKKYNFSVSMNNENKRKKDPNKIKNYIQYFSNNEILAEVQKDIIIKTTLGKYMYICDIDFFIKNEALGLMLIELKCKYKDKAGNFGINDMQFNLMLTIQNLGIDAYNIIFEKNKEEDVLDFCLRDDKKVLYSKISREESNIKYAPKKTSYRGGRIQKYHSIKGSQYKNFNMYNNFINLKCPKCQNRLVKRKSEYGTFLGCEKFKSAKCEGTISL